MLQLGKMLGHSVHPQIDAIERIFFCHLLKFLHNLIVVFCLSHYPTHLGSEGMGLGIHFSPDIPSNEFHRGIDDDVAIVRINDLVSEIHIHAL